MPFEFKKYSSEYGKKFREMKEKILSLSRRKIEIEHIGSTSIRGLGGKGIIDISIGIKKWSEASRILKILRKLGFKHFHKMENHSLFVSTKALCEEGDCHVHISRIGTKRYTRTLAFRDFLRKNPGEAERYEKIKKEIFAKCSGNRQVYKKLKNIYFINLKI